MGPLRFAHLTDLHLSDLPDTAASHVLEWAVSFANQNQPDFVAVSGDMSTFGTVDSADRLLRALDRIDVPVLFTPGNAELRSGGLGPLAELCSPERRMIVRDDVLALLPDTSGGDVPEAERSWMERTVCAHPEARRLVLITHYPTDRLGEESRVWLTRWICDQKVELLVAGHTHRHQTRRHGDCLEIVTRGLDPDKAIGAPPGASVFERSGCKEWTETFQPWTPPLELLPANLPDGILPVGLSIHGDPVGAAEEALSLDLPCLELRARDFNFSQRALGVALKRFRGSGPRYLSYHLPNLTWNSETGGIEGEEAMGDHLACALEAGVDSLTAHVPRATAPEMGMRDGDVPKPTDAWQAFEETHVRLFERLVRAGLRLAIENIHNPRNTPAASPARSFATRIDEYLCWIDTMVNRLAPGGRGEVGALLDVGHARNNGGELDNVQPLGDWYARVGHRILGYHIHQVDVNPQTGKLSNHLAIDSPFGPRMSYAGFLWAWSTRQIDRAPLFVEVRDEAGRRSTVTKLLQLFRQAADVTSMADLLE